MPTGYTIIDECETPEGRACVARELTTGRVAFFANENGLGRFVSKAFALSKLNELKKRFPKSEENSCNPS